MIGPPSSPVHTLHTLLEPPLVSGGWSGLHSTAMSAPPSPSVYKGVPADNQVIEGARGGCSPKWVWDNQWICYTAHLWICRSGLIVVIKHAYSRMWEIILKEFPATGILKIQDWELGPNCTEEGSWADKIVLFLTILKVTLCECVPQLSLASRRFDNVLSQPYVKLHWSQL